jgi:hypothetical protein
MPLRADFATLPSSFDAFLFAAVVEVESGAPLSVISALVRAGVDPWKESERLSKMRREAAGEALALLLSRVRGRWTAAELPAITARLLELLPARASEAASTPRIPVAAGKAAVQNWPVLLIALIGAGLLLLSIGS